MDNLIKLVAKKNNINIDTVEQFKSGQVNKVFGINGLYVLKIEGDGKNAQGVLEKQPARINQLIEKGARVPKLLDYGNFEGENYLLMEKIKGKDLASGWLKFTDQQKENFISQIAEQLRIFHSIKSDKYFDTNDNFKDAIAKETDVNGIHKDKLKPEYIESIELLENFYQINTGVLDETGTAVLNHNDLHFENIFYKGDKVTGIIDFDYTRFAPKDFELRKLIDFIHTPADYLDDSSYEDIHLVEVIRMLKKHYPEMFKTKDLVTRVRLYLRDDLLWTMAEYSSEVWSENTMIKTQRKIKDWYQSEWLEELLS